MRARFWVPLLLGVASLAVGQEGRQPAVGIQLPFAIWAVFGVASQFDDTLGEGGTAAYLSSTVGLTPRDAEALSAHLHQSMASANVFFALRLEEVCKDRLLIETSDALVAAMEEVDMAFQAELKRLTEGSAQVLTEAGYHSLVAYASNRRSEMTVIEVGENRFDSVSDSDVETIMGSVCGP